MLNLKSMIGASLFAVGAMAASSAFAYNPAGYSTAGPGSTSLTYAGLPIPCTGQFGVYVPSAGSSTAAIINTASYPTKFTGSATCTGITPNGLGATTGWAIGPASPVSGSPGVYSAPVSGVSVSIASKGITCAQQSTDTVTITLNNNTHTASFVGTLHTSAGVACSVNGSGLTTVITAP